MTNSTIATTLPKEMTTAAPVTSLNISSSVTTTNTTAEVTKNSNITSPSSSSSSSSSPTSSSTVLPTTSTEQRVSSTTASPETTNTLVKASAKDKEQTFRIRIFSAQDKEENGGSKITYAGSSAGAIVGGVLGGIVVVALVIGVMIFLHRRRKRRLKKKRAFKPPLAPGKDDISQIEERRRQKNQYTPPPHRYENKQEGLYVNVNEKGEPNELTDPALDSQGYLKSKTEKHKEPGSELYYETRAKSDRPVNTNKEKQDNPHVKIEKQPLYENEELHLKSTDHHNRNPENRTGSVKTYKNRYLKSNHGKHEDHVEMDTTQVYTNENVHTDTVDDEELDQEYEVPDPTVYPDPKKSKSNTYVNETKDNKSSKSLAKENTKKRNKLRTENEKPRESQYENMKNSAKYTNVGHAAEASTDEFYEVPENR